MASTYVNDLRLEEIGTGDQSGTWGTTTNTNLELIGEALGYGTQDCFSSDADATTTVADGATDPARSMYFKVTSSATLSATRTLTIAPNTVSRVMFIENATTGSQSITISQGSGANVTIATGKTAVVYLDGAGSGAAVVDAMALVDPGVTDTLAEVLTAGNTTGGTDITFSAGDNITNASGDFTIDIAGDIILDADGGDFVFQDGGTNRARVKINDSSNVDFEALTADHDIRFRGVDGSSTITALTLDMSEAGRATFNDNVNLGDTKKLVLGDGDDLQIYHDGSNNYIAGATSDQDLIFQGVDGGSAITALTLDMSAAGAATFNGNLTVNGADVTITSNIIHSGDTNTFFGFPSDDTFRIVTANTEALRVDSSQNVGIGTTSPSQKLSVVGNIASTGVATPEIELVPTGSVGNADIRFNGTTLDIRSNSASASLLLSTASTERLRIDSSGNVLVGTTETDIGFTDSGAGFSVSPLGAVQVARSSVNELLYLNKLDNDGDIIRFSKDGTEVGTIAVSSTDLTLDVAGDIILDADGGDWRFKDAGTSILEISNVSSSAALFSAVSDADMLFKGNDGGSAITALTLDMSQAGEADFNSAVKVAGGIVAHQTNRGVLEYASNVFKIRSYGATSGTGIVAISTGGGGASADSEAMRIDSNGKLLIGDTASHTSDLLQIETPASGGGHGIQIRRNDANGDQTIGTISFGNNTDTDLARISAKTDGDGNSGDSGALLLSTQVTSGSLTERMRITSAGNVGIGTSSPSNLLSLKSGTNTDIEFGSESGGGFIQTYNRTSSAFGYLRFITASSETMRLDSSGNVNIGRTSTLNAGQASILAAASKQALTLQVTSDGNSLIQGFDSSGNLEFQVTGGGAVYAAGNVGIGISSPSTDALHVVASGLDDDDDTIVLGANFSSATTLGSIGTHHEDVNNGGLKFSSKTSGTLTERVRIDASGNLLVGTTTPAVANGTTVGIALTAGNQLAIGTSSDVTAYLNRISADGKIAEFRKDGTEVGSIGTNSGFLYIGGTSGNDAFLSLGTDGVRPATSAGAARDAAIDLGGSSNRFKDLFLSGNLLVDGTSTSPGAGNTSTGFSLKADGQFFASSPSGDDHVFNINGTGNIISIRTSGTQVGTISVSGSATAYNTSSDYRLKENVVAMSGATERLKQLKPSRFNFIADPDETVDGFLAHEVQDVVPEAITGTKDAVDAEGNPEYQGIDQSKLVPLLVATIQELEARIAQLEGAN